MLKSKISDKNSFLHTRYEAEKRIENNLKFFVGGGVGFYFTEIYHFLLKILLKHIEFEQHLI